MHAYIYDGDLYCVTCGKTLCETLPEPPNYDPDKNTHCSSEYPDGPIADGGGLSDYPCHCVKCGEFLANPLTVEGRECVAQSAEQEFTDNGVVAGCVKMWCEYYDIPYPCQDEPDDGFDEFDDDLDEVFDDDEEFDDEDFEDDYEDV